MDQNPPNKRSLAQHRVQARRLRRRACSGAAAVVLFSVAMVFLIRDGQHIVLKLICGLMIVTSALNGLGDYSGYRKRRQAIQDMETRSDARPVSCADRPPSDPGPRKGAPPVQAGPAFVEFGSLGVKLGLGSRPERDLTPGSLIRPATPQDADAIAALFHRTVLTVNRRDYSAAQVAAWAGPGPDPAKWRERQATRATFVEESAGVLRGFAELGEAGHVDAVYVHADAQGLGVGSALLRRIEREATTRGMKELTTEASITARPFFERHGFHVLAVQTVEYQGEEFRNYRMAKTIA